MPNKKPTRLEQRIAAIGMGISMSILALESKPVSSSTMLTAHHRAILINTLKSIVIELSTALNDGVPIVKDKDK